MGFEKRSQDKSSKSLKIANKDIPQEYLSNNNFYKKRTNNKAQSQKGIFDSKKPVQAQAKTNPKSNLEAYLIPGVKFEK